MRSSHAYHTSSHCISYIHTHTHTYYLTLNLSHTRSHTETHTHTLDPESAHQDVRGSVEVEEVKENFHAELHFGLWVSE
jgi:hypothetical protein